MALRSLGLKTSMKNVWRRVEEFKETSVGVTKRNVTPPQEVYFSCIEGLSRICHASWGRVSRQDAAGLHEQSKGLLAGRVYTLPYTACRLHEEIQQL